ncbi:hypothetical protein [Microbacterium sp. G2-8]|uniref:hypothetical protein n=1 Tax=Microbacterium sp. G2-8 TaxID=2842454 RepID=UPI001C8AB06D|nr:hypothetical protein [Microbacterium sp. G2-8]
MELISNVPPLVLTVAGIVLTMLCALAGALLAARSKDRASSIDAADRMIDQPHEELGRRRVTASSPRRVVAVALRHVWESITEPRHITSAFFVVYLIVTYTGITTLVSPPRTVEGSLGDPLSTAWAILLIAGGVGGALAVLPGWWWAERLAIILTGAGIGIYGIVVLGRQLETSGSRLTQLGVIALAGALFAVRWLLIRGYSFEPRPEAPHDD